MKKIPDELTGILTEIDEALKTEGVSPHARPIHAIIEFGKRYKMSIPLTKTVPSGAPAELVHASQYSAQIHDWYERVYGNKIKVDFSEKAKVAVLANGDIWEVCIPKVFGLLIIEATRKLVEEPTNKMGAGPITINACAALTDITPARLAAFKDADLAEVYSVFKIGLDVRAVFDRFHGSHQLFIESKGDWSTATMHLTAQSPNYGQSRWASLQMCEKFMKGLIKVIGVGNPKQNHNLDALHDELAKSIYELDLKHLVSDIQCTAAVRYGEALSSREQAYIAHKSSLLLIRTLGSVTNANG